MSEQFNFSNSVEIAVNFGFSPNNQPDFTANLTGESTLLFSDPVDALVNDPLLGNVGTVDNNADVIKVEFVSSSSTGSTPFASSITATVGDNVPDFSPTPNDAELPFESLYSAGAIVGDPENGTVDSFFELFLAIENTPEGTIRNKEPIIVEESAPLTDLTFEENFKGFTYTSAEIIKLYDAGTDGVFWTGDENEVARLVPGTSGYSVVLNLTPEALSWSNNDDLIFGEADSDDLFGEDGNDVLVGGACNDTLTGGSGRDIFVFEYLAGNISQINDFSVSEDIISVSADGFGVNLTPNSVLASDMFVLGTAAVDNNDHFIFDNASGSLFFDLDGVGGIQQVEIAKLSPETDLTADNIFVDSNGVV